MLRDVSPITIGARVDPAILESSFLGFASSVDVRHWIWHPAWDPIAVATNVVLELVAFRSPSLSTESYESTVKNVP
jgi:hypothetical protein